VKNELAARKIVVRGRGRSDTVSLMGAEPVERSAAPLPGKLMPFHPEHFHHHET
jgi:hypothetical protein